MKESYARRLKRTLNEHAQLKEAQGQNGAVAELRKRGTELQERNRE
jgi:hypothetical protein